jgi:hypothetical protein
MNWQNEETALVNDWYYDDFMELSSTTYEELEVQPTAADFELYVWKNLNMDSMPIGLAYSVLNKTLSKVIWQQFADYYRVPEDEMEDEQV